MSYVSYKDGKMDTVWDFECPECGGMWNNESDPIEEGEEAEEECPGCDKTLIVTAHYSVDYELRVKEPPSEAK